MLTGENSIADDVSGRISRMAIQVAHSASEKPMKAASTRRSEAL